MSQINVNNIRAKDGVGAVGFPGGINVTGVVTATPFSGNVSIGGTLTYEDVTNIDSVGIITARDGIVADGFKVEEGVNVTGSLTGGHTINLNQGHVHRFPDATTGNYSLGFRIDANTTLGSKMDVGDVTSATVIVASSSHYLINPLEIDGSGVGITTSWIGGSAPDAANGSGYDIYAFTIMKTSATPTYHIIANTLSAA